MTLLWYGLMANLAIVAIFVTAWMHIKDWLTPRVLRGEPAAFGIAMGVGAVAVMSFPAQLQPGIIFDLRATMLALAGAFGGPLAAAIALVVAVGFRLSLGGAGALVGAISLLVAAIVGLAFWPVLRREDPSRKTLIWLALAVAMASFLTPILLSSDLRGTILRLVSGPQAVLIFCSLLLSSLALRQDNRRRALMQENLAYRAIIEALPDSLSVKDLDGRFLTANAATAGLMQVPDASALIGHTDADFHPPPTVAALAQGEGAVLETGQPQAVEQVIARARGETLWLSTLKVPLRDTNGDIVGVITHNRDITDRKQLELELENSQKQLAFALAQMTDGVAMYDAEGRLVFCNEQYRASFPRSSHVRVPGAHIRDILQTAMDTGEQLGITDVPAWIDEISGALFRDHEEEVHLFDGRWLRVSTRPTSDGASMVVVSEITKLKLQAATDGLTGLTNRRAMDQALETELARTAREEMPISVILLDIDLFKPFNDHYGHQAGDEALRAVSRCFAETFRRPGDIVARYGGEEFFAILPNTDEDGAYHLANAFRSALSRLALPHAASPRGMVTASLGLATYGATERDRYADEIVARADEALYVAKSAGRDRVYGWKPGVGRRPAARTGTHS